METKIIESLRAALYDTKWCKSDFERYDVPALEKNDGEPFFWYADRNGTLLKFVGASSINKMLGDKRSRFAIFREFDAPIGDILFYAQMDRPHVLYYWDGRVLCGVTFEGMRQIWANLFEASYKEAADKYADEYVVRNQPLPVIPAPGSEDYFQKTLEYGKSLGDNSLQICLEHLAKRARCSVDHEIEVSAEYMEHSLYFVERIDGEVVSNGGIIYSPEKKQYRWQIHT